VTVLLFGHLQFANLTCDPFLAGRELIDVAPYLLLSDGDLVDGLPHRVEINRYCVEPLLIGG
jgi:hypothetical protein